MVTIVCFMWNVGFREYTPAHVNALARQAAKHCTMSHRFVCVTDEAGEYDSNVDVMPLPESARHVAKIPSPEGKRYPASYRRLWCFSDEARCLGERIMMIDVDALIVGDLAPLFDYPDDFVGWRPNACWGKENRIGGGTWMLRTGTHTQVWDDFIANPRQVIAETRQAGWRGSDQAYLSRKLLGCKVWPKGSGIYQKQDGVHNWREPPNDARIVHFNGERKPWQSHQSWVREALTL